MKKRKMTLGKKLFLGKEMVSALHAGQQAGVLGGVNTTGTVSNCTRTSLGQEWCPGGPTYNQTEHSAAPGCACCVRDTYFQSCNNTLQGPGGNCN
ncbi:MAG TPA: class I lanthipeptide [Chitinophagaceae bacterium]|nr:class I lanthipeptide [Chitinophagaceae bacterium]